MQREPELPTRHFGDPEHAAHERGVAVIRTAPWAPTAAGDAHDVIDLVEQWSNPQEGAIMISLRLLRDHLVRRTVLWRLAQDGSFTPLASFGSMPCDPATDQARITLWDHHPVALSARHRASVRTPHSAADDIVELAVPFVVRGAALGAISCAIEGASSESLDQADATMSLFARALALAHMSHQGTTSTGGSSVAGMVPLAGDATDQFTDRQVAILGLVADGYTNAQIAVRVGFSESTVRVDLLSAFRSLGIHERRAAAAEAARRGLLGVGAT